MNPAPEWTRREVDAPSADLMTKTEVARLLGVSEDTVDRLITDGEFPDGLKVGKQTRVWDWRSVAYYRLRLEMVARFRPQATATDRS